MMLSFPLPLILFAASNQSGDVAGAATDGIISALIVDEIRRAQASGDAEED